MTITQREDDFQQRLIASTIPFDPSLESIAPLLRKDQEVSHVDEEQIFFPTTEEEFQEMVSLWDDQTIP